MVEILKTVVETATTFPTLIFTVLLGLVLVYWAISLRSGGGSEGAVEGAAEGLLEGLTEGAVDGLAEGVFEAGADGLVDGTTEGLGETAGGLARFLGCLGITAVPVTLFVSILIGMTWGTSILLSHLIGTHIGLAKTGLLVGSLTGIAAMALGLLITAWAVRPLRPLFRSDSLLSRKDLIGRVCILTTQKVDAEFGVAEFDDRQARLLLQVRCPEPNTLKRGDAVRITAFDPEKDELMVAPAAVTYDNEHERT